MTLMQHKRGLVVGIANERSYAWYIAQSLMNAGAQCVFTHLPGEKMERRTRLAIEALGVDDPILMSMDARSDEDLDRVFGDLGSIDYLVHSIAYAEKEWLAPGKFAATPREVFLQALDISTYTFMAMANRAAPLMKSGGSIIAMSYYGAEKAIPGYNVMGVAKSALESATRYLAMELGDKNIRVNTISGGPLRTMSAMAVTGFSTILELVEQRAPLKRNVTGEDVGEAATWLLSDMASGVTGQILYVDCGYSAVGL